MPTETCGECDRSLGEQGRPASRLVEGLCIVCGLREAADA